MTGPLPTIEVRGRNLVMDTCSWLNFAAAPELAIGLLRCTRGRLFVPEEVVGELGARVNAVVSPTRVALSVTMTTRELGDWRGLLRDHWDRDLKRNRGEAACIALATTRGWSVLMDDGVGIDVAISRGLPVMRTANLLLAGTAARCWTCEEAWAGFQQMLAARRNRLGPELWDWNSQSEFLRVCDRERRLLGATPSP